MYYEGCDIEMIKRYKSNAWLKVTISEGKNREVRNLMRYGLNLKVSRLMRVQYADYNLNGLNLGELKEVRIAGKIWSGYDQ